MRRGLLRSGEKVPAEVCLLDREKQLVFYSHIRPDQPLAKGERRGGVPWHLLEGAPTLKEVIPDLQRALQGCLLVGYGLGSDLGALGLQRSSSIEAKLDLAFMQLFKQRSPARQLKVVAKELLHRDIQAGKLHSAREDALAIMDLFLQYAHQSPDADAAIIEAHFLRDLMTSRQV
ncbi:hypothetical protein WJX73_000098 [Symbiochloris irregularis]|uniref:Exonuclease domain-containing protein n=1 Tax=Symbiochloris irregularis TaxID=706552 RepID=A0AAW1NZ87_9CHLO